MTSRERLGRIIYRGILRWAKDHSDAPFSLQQQNVVEVIPELQGVQLKLQDSSAVRYLARFGFDQEKKSDQDVDEALDRGITALRLLNTRYAEVVQAMRDTRARNRGNTVKFPLGLVFRHKQYDYKGVIYGFDHTCMRDQEWIKQMGVKNADQPFYYVLPDEHDCQRLFNSIRLTKYVAEENILPLEKARIVHRALDNYFLGYSESIGRYIPVKRLQFEYPDSTIFPEYENIDDITPAGEDSNLLLHDSEEEEEEIDFNNNNNNNN